MAKSRSVAPIVLALLTVILGLAAGVAGACSIGRELLSEEASVAGAAATTARAAATPIPTPVRTATSEPPARPRAPTAQTVIPTPAPVEDVLALIDSAFARRDLGAIRSILLDRVLLVSREGPTTLSRDEALDWMISRSGDGQRVQGFRVLEGDGVLEVVVGSWPDLEQFYNGYARFRLRRFNDRGQLDYIQGHWMIEAIVPEPQPGATGQDSVSPR